MLLRAIREHGHKRVREESVRCDFAIGERATHALKQRSGFTITEALATVIIAGLVTSILAGGIALATKQYTQSMSNSEAQMLCSSLQKILDTELRFTSTISTSGSAVNGEYAVTGFESKHYKAKDTSTGGAASYTATSVLCTVAEGENGTVIQTPDNPGQLAMASSIANDAVYNPFLGSGAYNYGLEASVEKLTYNESGKYFTVELAISQGSGNDTSTLVSETFTVKALNNPQRTS